MKKIKNLFLLRWYSIGLRLVGELILVLYILLSVLEIIVYLFENGGLINYSLVSGGGIFIGTSISLICFSQIIDWTTRVYDNVDFIKKKALNQPVKEESYDDKFYSNYNLFTVIIILVSIGLYLINQISFSDNGYGTEQNDAEFDQTEYSRFDNTELEKVRQDLTAYENNETALKLEIVELKKEISFRDSIQNSLENLNQLRAAISLPEMNMLYRDYNNQVTGAVSGYNTYNLSMTNGNISKSGQVWIAKPGSGKESSITITGISGDKRASLGTFKYKVSALPPPDVQLGNIKSGDAISKGQIYGSTKFFAKYGPEIPLDVTFKVVSWELRVSGAPRPIKGSGSSFSGAGRSLLKKASKGSVVLINTLVKGPDGSLRKRNMSFTIR